MATRKPLAAITSGPALTPSRARHNRPSHSPIKSPPVYPPGTTLRPSRSLTALRGSQPSSPGKKYDLPTSALDFKEFSFLAADGTINQAGVTREHVNALLAYLQQHFKAREVLTTARFIVIGCEEEPPPADERPFSVAGLIAIWRRSDDMDFNPDIGIQGRGGELAIDPQMAARVVRPISHEVVEYLANTFFPTCIAITMVGDNTLIVELSAMNDAAYHQQLRTLPCRLSNTNVLLFYHNGSIAGEEASQRAIKPCPQYIRGARDATDYVEQDSKFYPGVMIGSLDSNGSLQSLVTCGIKLRRGSDEKVLCPYHCWEKQDQQNPGLLGQTGSQARRVFSVQQGKDPGTQIGFLQTRILETDLALAQLYPTAPFENVFMESDYSPKVLQSQYEQQVGAEYVFDSYCTGKQRLRGLGTRYSLCKTAGPEPHSYVALEQGAYMSNEPFMAKPPFIRQGICGSVLLKCKNNATDTTDTDTVMRRGEVAGMMHFVNERKVDPNMATTYLCFADTFDPLIHDGWKVATGDHDTIITDTNDDDLTSSMGALSIDPASPSERAGPYRAGRQRGGRHETQMRGSHHVGGSHLFRGGDRAPGSSGSATQGGGGRGDGRRPPWRP